MPQENRGPAPDRDAPGGTDLRSGRRGRFCVPGSLQTETLHPPPESGGVDAQGQGGLLPAALMEEQGLAQGLPLLLRPGGGLRGGDWGQIGQGPQHVGRPGSLLPAEDGDPLTEIADLPDVARPVIGGQKGQGLRGKVPQSAGVFLPLQVQKMADQAGQILFALPDGGSLSSSTSRR